MLTQGTKGAGVTPRLAIRAPLAAAVSLAEVFGRRRALRILDSHANRVGVPSGDSCRHQSGCRGLGRARRGQQVHDGLPHPPNRFELKGP